MDKEILYCPACNSNDLHRMKRTAVDKAFSFFYKNRYWVKRYKCMSCFWEGRIYVKNNNTNYNKSKIST